MRTPPPCSYPLRHTYTGVENDLTFVATTAAGGCVAARDGSGHGKKRRTAHMNVAVYQRCDQGLRSGETTPVTTFACPVTQNISAGFLITAYLFAVAGAHSKFSGPSSLHAALPSTGSGAAEGMSSPLKSTLSSLRCLFSGRSPLSSTPSSPHCLPISSVCAAGCAASTGSGAWAAGALRGRGARCGKASHSMSPILYQ